MDWLNHPSYRPVRDVVIEKFTYKKQKFRRLNRIVFLCGGANSPRRARIFEYLRKRRGDDILVFYADNVWLHIVKSSPANALDLEEQLAHLADIVIIIVESPGTFAELGAFSINSVLRKKLLPIVDVKYANDESFINTGPIRWTNDESTFAPSIVANFSIIASIGQDIESRIDRLPRQTTTQLADVRASAKHLLFLVCDLVAVIGPATTGHVLFYMQRIVGEMGNDRVVHLLGLAVALELVRSHDVGSVRYYVPRQNGLQPYGRRPFFNLPVERARVLGALLGIEAARTVMSAISPQS